MDKIKITREGYDRLRQVQDWLRSIRGSDDNNKFDMDLWQCGSTCCIAGKAATLAGQTMYKTDFYRPVETMRLNQKIGEEVCGIEEGRGNVLFYVLDWPEYLHAEYNNSFDEPDTQIDLAISRIDLFLDEEVEVVDAL